MKRISRKTTLMSVLLGVFLLSGCGTPTIEPAAGSSGVVEGKAFVLREENGVTIVKQIDETLPLDGISFEVDGLDEEFSLYLGDLKAKGADKPLITSVYSLFLADVNNDGHHDFIYTTGARLRMEAGTWIGIYDYHNDKELYRLDDPTVFDYDLRFENGKFIVSQFNTDYYDSKNILKLNRLVGKGILDYSNPTVTVEWQNFLHADSFNISVTTADSSRTPITMKAGQRENTFVVEHAVADKAYCITTNLVRNNGNYDDLLTNLPVGYFADCRLVQAAANNHQDNVIVSFEGAIQGMEEGTYFVEACVSGYEFEIYFDFDTLED
ncbi:MAG: hypothetical protein K6G74_00450, partial [Bacilli bacterium]|nr:hypothetical protein [Bacilli bacterium]